MPAREVATALVDLPDFAALLSPVGVRELLDWDAEEPLENPGDPDDLAWGADGICRAPDFAAAPV